MFSGVGAHGNTGGDSGGGSLLGHGHWTSSLEAGTPVLEHLVGLLEVTEWRPAGGVIGSHDPTDGKSGGTTPRSMQAERERKVPVTWLDT